MSYEKFTPEAYNAINKVIKDDFGVNPGRKNQKVKKQPKVYGPYNIEPDKEALAYLEDSNLMKNLIKETGKFVVGEKNSILTIGLAASGRLVTNANRTSYNVIPNDDSGCGKDHVTKNTLKVFVPEEHIAAQSRITPTYINYWHTKDTDPNWSWDGKVLYLTDVSDNILNSEVMKTFLSDNTKAGVIRKQYAIELEIVGKPCVFCTTANSTPGQEQLRRFFLLPLNSTRAQTQAIKRYMAEMAVSGEYPTVNPVVEKAMHSLKRVKVIVPFGVELINKFPDDLIARTYFQSFIDLIKASAALHQYQRDWNKDETAVIATLDDYENARIAITQLTSNGGLVPITKNQRYVLDTINTKLDKNGPEKLVNSHFFWSVREIEEKCASISHTGLYKLLDSLLESKHLEKGEKEAEVYETTGDYGTKKTNRNVMAYKIKPVTKLNLPSKEELEAEMMVNIDESYTELSVEDEESFI
jgi:hypothetical protein